MNAELFVFLTYKCSNHTYAELLFQFQKPATFMEHIISCDVQNNYYCLALLDKSETEKWISMNVLASSAIEIRQSNTGKQRDHTKEDNIENNEGRNEKYC